MDAAELSFNAWILIGNVLATLLRGQSPVAHGPGRDRLLHLEMSLVPIQPTQMLQALRNLPAADRHILLEACIASQIAEGADAETSLGLNQLDAAAVVAFLQNPIA